MKRTFYCIVCLLLFTIYQEVKSQSEPKTRLIILADMGNEPDEEQQMVHMIMCSNEFDLEGLIAVTGKYLRPESNNPYKQILHPELFHGIIDGYSLVLDNLKKHADGWSEPEYLHSIVKTGQEGYGIESTGPDLSSEGSDLIIEALKKEDPRPLYIVVNAGSNTLAQALKDLRKKSGKDEILEYIKKIRVFENGAQDNAGAWICSEFSEIHWVRSNYQTYCYAGPSIDGAADNLGSSDQLGPYTWEPYSYSGLGQHQWALEHIKANHGPLGNYWPLRQFRGGGISFMEGGGTIPWLCLVNKGLSDIDRPWWGGWSGRYGREKSVNYWSKHSSVNKDEKAFTPFYVYAEEEETWVNPENGKRFEGIYVPVWRWRRAFFNDFKCRMDWCIKDFDEANHHPVAVINNNFSNELIIQKVKPGEVLEFDASGSYDPDGNMLSISWYIYYEAGTYKGDIHLNNQSGTKTKITIPEDSSGKEIHLILEVKDENPLGSLFDYRRIVFNVNN